MMTLNEIRKLRGMTLSEFSRQSGLSPHTARNLMGYRELYGNPRLDTMVDAARALNAVVTITPKGVTIRARKESASLMALDVRLTHCYLIMTQNPQGCFTTPSGKSVDAKKATERLDKMAQKLGELIDKENDLLQGMIGTVNRKA